MCIRTNSRDRVSGYDCELKDNNLVFTSGKVSENKESVCGGVQGTRDNLVRTNTFLETLTSTVQAILQARLQFRYLQQQQIATLKRSVSYMTAMAKEELAWWIKKLELSNGRTIMQPPSQILMQTDTSKKGWGAVGQGIRTGGLWSKK